MLTTDQKAAIQEKANRLGFLQSERLALIFELNGLVSTVKTDTAEEVAQVEDFLFDIAFDSKVGFDGEFRPGSRYNFWMPSAGARC